MEIATIISNAKLNKMLEEEETGKRNFMYYIGEREVEGLLYGVWNNKRDGKTYAVREFRSVHMGFNSNEPDKIDEFESIMKREGICNVSWGVTGRTMHKILAHQLAAKYPQYKWTIGDNYECRAEVNHRMTLMPGFEPEVEI